MTSDARPNLVASISATVRSAPARAALTTSASGRREVVSPASSVMPAAETNAQSKFSSPGTRPSSGRRASACAGRARPGTTTTCIGSALHLVGDRGRVRDERELVRRVLHQPPGERQRARRGRRGRSSTRGRPARPRRAAIASFAAARLLDPLRPRRRDQRQPELGRREAPAPARRRARARPAPRARAAQVAVDGDRRDRVVAGELGHRDAAVALDALQDLGSAQGGRHGVQTRSSNALRVTVTSTGGTRRWPSRGDLRIGSRASSPFSAVAVIGLPMTPVRENSPWSMGKTKYW